MWNFWGRDLIPSGMMKFYFLKLGSIALLAVCIASSIPAIAQSKRHTRMDVKAAKADIQRLQVIRRRCIKYKNYRKLDQTNRLIAEDQRFINQDKRKIRKSSD